MPCKEADGTWSYPDTGEVLEKVGLYPIADYIAVRRNTILKFISQRPIYELCKAAGRRRGSGNRQYWWEQTMELEEKASDSTESGVASSEDGDSL